MGQYIDYDSYNKAVEDIATDLLEHLLDDKEFNDDFCAHCGRKYTEQDTGAVDCPCGFDAFDPRCPRMYHMRNIDSILTHAAEKILEEFAYWA